MEELEDLPMLSIPLQCQHRELDPQLIVRFERLVLARRSSKACESSHASSSDFPVILV